ncbi:hypothetical protein V8E54_005308 [Elaphomyces granulatus]
MGRLVIFVLSIETGTAVSSSFLPDTFTAWYWQSSLVVDKWLYIDGGEIWGRWYGPTTNPSYVWNMQTMAIDLSSSWTPTSVTVVATNKSTDILGSSSLLGRRPDMWYDPTADSVYSIGGLSYNIDGRTFNPNVVPTLWGFKPQSNGSVDWISQSSITNPQSTKLRSNVAGGLRATSPTGHYNLGGFIDLLDWVEPNGFALEEMLLYNSGNKSFYNLTLAGQHYMWGEAQYIPIYGAGGVILFFGGFWPSDTTVDAPSSLTALLDTILIYDIHTNRFFKQPASNPPSGRALFCSVAAGASNNESYEIFIYGGTQTSDAPTAERSLDDNFRNVYILTVPAFQWLQAPNQSPIHRVSHTCSIIGGTKEGGFGSRSDPWTNGLGIFDMTTLSWTNAYDATAPAYERPGLVSQFYANNSRYPTEWGDPELKSIFEMPNGTANLSGGNNNSSNDNSNIGGGDNKIDPGTTTNVTANVSTSGSGMSSSNAIASSVVVGGVIGGAAALAIIASLIYWRCRALARSGRPTISPTFYELPT